MITDDEVKLYKPIVISVATSFSRTLWNYELDDLISIGLGVLVNCYDKYDETQGTKFTTFLYGCLKRTYLTMSYKNRHKGRYRVHRSLDESLVDGDPLHEVLGYNPHLDNGCMIDNIMTIVSKMNQQYQSVFKRYFIDNLTMVEIAGEMGVSKQRIGQIITSIKKQLCEEFGYNYVSSYNRGRRVKAIHKDTGEEFVALSIKELASLLNIKESYISRVLRGYGKSANGYYLSFID